MKNIHILETSNPSRLVKQKYDTINRLCLADMATKRAEYKRFNIYITNDEYIGLSYYLDGDLVRKGVVDDKDYWEVRKDYKKIILTTDLDLIKEGVQAIDDEFLEWFIKNPSCEEIFVNTIEGFDFKLDKYVYDYKIIIPKEELSTNLHKGEVVDKSYPKEFKQETLEEAKKYLSHEGYGKGSNFTLNCVANLMIEWQKEQDKNKYSEEEVFDLMNEYAEDVMGGCNFRAKKWLKQVKKKIRL